MKLIINSLAILFILIANASAQKNASWQLSGNNNGVKIYIRKGENSNLKEVLGLTTIKTTLSALVFLVKDSENHYQWIYANKKASLIKSINDFEWIYYNESEAPWPVSNRDLITHAKMKQDSISLKIIINSIGLPNYLAEKEGLVRVPKLKSVWVFTPKNNGFVDVQFELAIDLGGNIPPWLVNISIDRGPMHTLANMAKVLEQSRYKNVKLSYIREKMN